jgi:hypothetical protein
VTQSTQHDRQAAAELVGGTGLAVAAVARAGGSGRAGGRPAPPADLLISSDGVVVACMYGEHASDRWSVDELLGHAGRARRTG